MKNQAHIKAFEKLGREIERSLNTESDKSPLNIAIQKSYEENLWFIPEFTKKAIKNIAYWLTIEKLSKWIEKYPAPTFSRKIGIIMAGNIPLVGFHDFLCTLISGHTAIIKLSGKDQLLLPAIANELIKIEPDYEQKIQFVSNAPKEVDAIIATGSDNTARYFDYNFNGIPRIIRKNRTSAAVINGMEPENELIGLADDICTFFGHGCRNISKVYLPDKTTLNRLVIALSKYKWMLNHEYYSNNVRYQKARLKALDIPYVDGGPVLFIEEEQLNSPVGIVNIQYYDSIKNVEQTLEINAEKIQCIVGSELINSVNLGSAQKPDVNEYADNVDTLEFLTAMP